MRRGVAIGKVVLRDYSMFCARVAAAYEAAPRYEPRAEPSYRALRASIERLYRRLLSRIEVVFVDGQPYASAAEMRREVWRTGVLAISRDFNTHLFFSPEENLRFRAVHDYVVHIVGRGHPEFGQRGEIRAFNLHRALAPVGAWPALFTEVVGQVCFETVRGYFPEQKVAILDGFDFVNVGLVEGCRVERKRLVCEA
mgnify:CR=1 FL=1